MCMCYYCCSRVNYSVITVVLGWTIAMCMCYYCCSRVDYSNVYVLLLLF